MTIPATETKSIWLTGRYQQAYPRSSRKKSNLGFFWRNYKLQIAY